MGAATVPRPSPSWPNASSDRPAAARPREVANAGRAPTGEDRRRNPAWRRHLVMLVRHEFSDLPGLHLSIVQAQRLFGLRPDICQRVLSELVREGFLCCDQTGVFKRRDIVA